VGQLSVAIGWFQQGSPQHDFRRGRESQQPRASQVLINEKIAKVDFDARNFTGLRSNRELAYSPAQNEAFTTRIVDAAEALFLGKGQ